MRAVRTDTSRHVLVASLSAKLCKEIRTHHPYGSRLQICSQCRTAVMLRHPLAVRRSEETGSIDLDAVGLGDARPLQRGRVFFVSAGRDWLMHRWLRLCCDAKLQMRPIER